MLLLSKLSGPAPSSRAFLVGTVKFYSGRREADLDYLISYSCDKLIKCSIKGKLRVLEPSRRAIMNSSPATLSKVKTTKSHEVAWQWCGMLYLRLALGVSFLSGIADRFGLYKGRNVGYGDFAGFIRYTAQVNSFMPASTIPFLAWAATVAELAFGLALVFGIWLRWAALGSFILLLLFGTAMAISFGIKSPLDYSVFSASAGALILALYDRRK